MKTIKKEEAMLEDEVSCMEATMTYPSPSVSPNQFELDVHGNLTVVVEHDIVVKNELDSPQSSVEEKEVQTEDGKDGMKAVQDKMRTIKKEEVMLEDEVSSMEATMSYPSPAVSPNRFERHGNPAALAEHDIVMRKEDSPITDQQTRLAD